MNDLGNALLRELELIYEGGGMRVFREGIDDLRIYGILAAGGLIKEIKRVSEYVDYEITSAGDALLSACAADPDKFLLGENG